VRSGDAGLLHPLVTWIGNRGLRWFYRELCYIGLDRVPADGPVLLVGNHPNDIPDTLLGYGVTRRRLRYVATLSAAASAIARITYEGLGIIPVARVRDARALRRRGVDVTAVNDAALDAVVGALVSGSAVGVFPEGGVQDLPHLGSIRRGVAQMIHKTLVDGAIECLRVVPFGIRYDAPRVPRSDVTVLIGEPVTVRADDIRDDPLALTRLTTLVREALWSVTRNADSWAAADERDQATAAVAAARGRAAGAVRVVAATEDALEMTPEQRRLVGTLADAVADAGGIPTSPRDHARVLHAAGVEDAEGAWPFWPALWLATPVGLLGWALHAPVFAVTWSLAHRLAKTRADLVARAFVPGLYLILLWYLLLVALLATGLHATGRAGWWALFALPLLPRLGDIGVWWRDGLGAWRVRQRVRAWPTGARQALCAAAAALRHAASSRTPPSA
jgi:1-acyl-sn-glycerol-3-phosphate acyltransferase